MALTSKVGQLAGFEGDLPKAAVWNWRVDSERQPTWETYSASSLIPSIFSLLGEPTVTVYPAKTQPLQHHNLLVCSVNGFYLGHVEVRWFWKGQEEEAGVISTGLIQNGDWTFQTMVMLERTPQRSSPAKWSTPAR